MLLVNKADPWNKMNLDYNDAVIDNIEGKNILSSSRKVIFLYKNKRWEYYCEWLLQVKENIFGERSSCKCI